MGIIKEKFENMAFLAMNGGKVAIGTVTSIGHELRVRTNTTQYLPFEGLLITPTEKLVPAVKVTLTDGVEKVLPENDGPLRAEVGDEVQVGKAGLKVWRFRK